MSQENKNRQQRRVSTGYQIDRGESQNRPDNRPHARTYSREDMRRYGRKAEEQGERLRRLRGQGHDTWDSQFNTDQTGIHDEHLLDFDRDMGRDWGYDRDYQPANRRNRSAAQNYRYRENMGYNMNRQDQGNMRSYYHERGPSMERDRYSRMAPSRQPGTDRYDNFWGERQQGRSFRHRDREAWWNNTGGRPDYTSARDYENNIPARPDFDWIEDRDYSVDPGFQYEFGTDFDFMDDDHLEDYGRPSNRPQRRGQNQRRSASPAQREEGRAGNRGLETQQRPGQHENQARWAEFEYGWQGEPDHPQARYREFWNIPGPYAGIGPLEYQRPDESIKEELYDLFTRHGQIDSSGIDIQVQDGNVILMGDVDRKAEKYLAEDIASEVRGVQNIDNRIRINTKNGARGMGRENVARPGGIQAGMRVAGVDGKRIGYVKAVRDDSFILERLDGSTLLVPFRAIKRTNGHVILHVHENEIDRQGWKTS